MINTACRICKTFSKNKELVRPGGAECFPTKVQPALEEHFRDCRDLPTTKYKKIKSVFVVKNDLERGHSVQWLAMAFSSVKCLKFYL